MGGLWTEALDHMVLAVCGGVNKENAEFAAEMLGFHVQVSLRRWGQARVLTDQYLGMVRGCGEKIVMQEEAPQEQFVKMFGQGYKKADEKAGKEEAEDDQMVEDEEEVKDVKADAVSSSVEFRHWRIMAKANASFLQVVDDIVSLLQTDDEDDYEEVDDDAGFEE